MGNAADFWDREISEKSHVSWLESEQIREYVNDLVAGEPGLWPFDWFQSKFPHRFERGLSIGCGTGALERDVIAREICSEVDAFDLSPASIESARAAAAERGFDDRIHYFIGDFNDPAVPANRYDIVFVHQALHHVAKLEKCFRAIRRTLKRGGVLYFDEYIGPSRFDWNQELLRPCAELYGRLPDDVRKTAELPLPIQPDDPSEAFRSSEIMTELLRGFRVIEQRDYGGNLLSVLYPQIAWDRADDELLPAIIEKERAMLQQGDGSYHTVVVARPKRGPAGMLASADYFLRPKLKRIGRELKARLSTQSS
jgi:SAM-dependent methyltransferase